MKKVIPMLAVLLLLISCSDTGTELVSPNSTGLVTVNMTDAPVSTTDLTKVNIRVNEISAQIGDTGDDGWRVLKSFDPGLDINLMELTGGITKTLAEDVELPAGRINQIRFKLDAPEEGSTENDSGCYLEYTQEIAIITKPLYIPGGSSSGFKITGSFEVPADGSVTLTADFNARKSLIYNTGTKRFKLKPSIRVIADSETGRIKGTVSDTGLQNLFIFAYKAGSYQDSEEIADTDGLLFTGTVNSCPVKNNSYLLPFLPAGEYEILLVQYIEKETGPSYAIRHRDDSLRITVKAEKDTIHNITMALP